MAPEDSVTPSEKRCPAIEESLDWQLESAFDSISRVEFVKSAISHYAAGAIKVVSGESILAICSNVIQSPIPLEKLTGVVQPLYASWGVRTGRERTECVHLPIGVVIASALCSLARHSQTIQNVEQHEQGCTLNAELPSSITALKGSICVRLERNGEVTLVNASTSIPGQIFDWGKSHRCLEQLIADLNANLIQQYAKQHKNAA